MKLADALKEKGNPFWIPDCHRNELPEFFKSLGFSVGAEIGVHKGEYSEKFCQAGLTIYAIDNWQRPGIYEKAVSRLKRYKNCTIIKKASIEAVKTFQSASLDFVYIDADHRFPFIAEDLFYWSEKVRKGGIISGHDYLDTRANPDESIRAVGPIVDAFIKTFQIDNFYIFGHPLPADKEQANNRTLSFMFFKYW